MLSIGNSREVGSSISHKDTDVGLNSTELNSKGKYLVPVWCHGEGIRGLGGGGEDDSDYG